LAWYDRYRRRVKNAHRPTTDEARNALAAVIGADGHTLLHASAAAVDQPWRREVPAVNTRRQVWAEPSSAGNGTLGWREVNAMPSPAELIASPDDPEARDSTTRESQWVGSTVHGTETCEADTPPVMVNVATTPATTPDEHMGTCVQTSLEQRALLPTEHLGDQG
jgi:transposase